MSDQHISKKNRWEDYSKDDPRLARSDTVRKIAALSPKSALQVNHWEDYGKDDPRIARNDITRKNRRTEQLVAKINDWEDYDRNDPRIARNDTSSDVRQRHNDRPPLPRSDNWETGRTSGLQLSRNQSYNGARSNSRSLKRINSAKKLQKLDRQVKNFDRWEDYRKDDPRIVRNDSRESSPKSASTTSSSSDGWNSSPTVAQPVTRSNSFDTKGIDLNNAEAVSRGVDAGSGPSNERNISGGGRPLLTFRPQRMRAGSITPLHNRLSVSSVSVYQEDTSDVSQGTTNVASSVSLVEYHDKEIQCDFDEKAPKKKKAPVPNDGSLPTGATLAILLVCTCMAIFLQALVSHPDVVSKISTNSPRTPQLSRQPFPKLPNSSTQSNKLDGMVRRIF